MAKYVERQNEVVAHKIIEAETFQGPSGYDAIDLLIVEDFDRKIASTGIANYTPGYPPGGYLMRSSSSFEHGYEYEYVSQKKFDAQYKKAD